MCFCKGAFSFPVSKSETHKNLNRKQPLQLRKVYLLKCTFFICSIDFLVGNVLAYSFCCISKVPNLFQCCLNILYEHMPEMLQKLRLYLTYSIVLLIRSYKIKIMTFLTTVRNVDISHML